MGESERERAMETQYRVLEERVGRDDFARYARALGFSHHDTWESGGPREPYEEAWANPDRTEAINYVEDPVSQQHYLTLRAADSDALADKVAGTIPVLDPEELIADSYRELPHDTHVTNLFRLAITFADADPEVTEIFRLFATEPANPLMRLAALEALGYRAFPEHRDIVAQVAEHDPDETVRAHAREVLGRWPA
jgi:hypothetical protein